MNTGVKKIITQKKQETNNQIFKPVFYNLSNPNDEINFVKLLNTSNEIVIIDEIQSQLEELIKLKYPKHKFSKEELEQKSKEHVGSVEIEKYGNWIYYPWLNKIVHLLGKEEFVEVRTNRNQYKITPEEENILSKKTIGIIGLSVGKAIALTIAMERICGKMIIADFDVIELSNLNRIQTGVHNFNIKKTVVVAREIAEIDPYLQVTCLHDGLTEENMKDFFFPHGEKIDLCIEVCDGLSTKIYARQKAKEYGVPVVMNSSDRGTTDIERYDLNSELPILHGLVDHLDLSLVKQAKTNEEKVPYLLPMLGVETSSERLKASMLEIEETITTWPQLASGVIMGGGICTDVSRRVLLNQFKNSGRYFVDVETMINDEVTDYISASSNHQDIVQLIPPTGINEFSTSIEQIEQKFSSNKQLINLSENEIKELVNHAIMAPSGGNIQPWKWLYKNQQLLLFHDPKRVVSILNYKNTASHISFGAATENLILKAHEMGYEVEIEQFPLGTNNDLIASFSFYHTATQNTEPHQQDQLVKFVPKRLTNRTLSSKITLSTEVENYLLQSVKSINGAEIKFIKEPDKLEALKNILSEVDKLYMTNKSGHHHFIQEIRWNQREVEETRDGIDINTIDLTPTEKAGLIVSKNWNVTKHIKKWNLGNEFGKLSRKAVDAASAMGVITMPSFTEESYFNGGRAIQKLWLTATEKNVAFQPMSISTFLFARISDGNFEEIEEIKDDLLKLYSKFKTICEIDSKRKDIFCFRLAIAPEPKIKALRRPIEDVLMYE